MAKMELQMLFRLKKRKRRKRSNRFPRRDAMKGGVRKGTKPSLL